MPKQSRVTDIGSGVCPNHPVPIPYTTVIMSGAKSSIVEGQPAAIITSIGSASCGCTSIALTGSKTSIREGQGSHRIGDVGTTGGTYNMITGSASVEIGD